MNAVDNNNADTRSAKGLRGWWATPARTGARRVINPIVYRHLRPVGIMHLVGGLVAALAGILCLSYGAYAWAAFFLVLGAGNLAGGSWYLSIDRSESTRA